MTTPKQPRSPWAGWKGWPGKMPSWLGGAGGEAGRTREAASAQPDGPPEVCRAWALIKAIDAGGVPLNPAIVNQIGRGLGLEVSSRAPIDETIERIRQALRRLAV